MFQLKPSPYHLRLLWVNYNKPGWSLMIRPPNYRISRVPLEEGELLDFRPTEFGGIGQLDKRAAAISQGLIGWFCWHILSICLDLGKCNIIKHANKITDPQPFKERYRRIPPHLYEEGENHLQEMVEVGAIRRSFSPWASTVVLVRKKRWGALVLYLHLQ